MSLGYAAYLRWAPAEWRYEGFGDEPFADMNRDLTVACLASGEDFDLYFDRLIYAMIDALAYLRVERAQMLEGVTLFVTISDRRPPKASSSNQSIDLIGQRSPLNSASVRAESAWRQLLTLAQRH